MNEQSNSHSKIIYQLNLNSRSLGFINPHLFVEKLKDEMLIKLPTIKVIVVYNAKGKGHPLVNLKFFSSKPLLDYEINNLKEEISFIAASLRDELASRIEEAKRS